MRRTYLICILLLLSFTACQKTIPKSYEITKIEMARSGAWLDFGATIIVDSSLNYTYWGDKDGIKQGYFAGKINPQFWDSLNKKIEKTRFKLVDTTTNLNVKDANYYELIIHWTGGKRKILRVSGTSDTILAFCRWMDTTYKSVKLHRLTAGTDIEFETHFHSKLKPIVDRIKFPPPVKKK